MNADPRFFTKDWLKDTPFSIGEYTYGRPEIHYWGEPVSLSIGKYCSFAQGVKIYLGGNHRTDWVSTYPFSGRSLNAVFPEARNIQGHPRSKGNIVIGNDVWFGAGSWIMSGVEIGHGACIGAGAVVTKNVGPYEIVVGNPARSVGFRFEAAIIKKLLEARWWDWDNASVRKAIPLLMSASFSEFFDFADKQNKYSFLNEKVPRELAKVHLEIVRGCQLRCLGCPNSTLNPSVKRISVKNFQKIMKNIDVERIHLLRLFNFGEPLLHNELPGILNEIRLAEIKIEEVEISTNAQFINWPVFEEALSLGVLTQLAVSCDGNGTPEDYERLRPPSKWSRLIEFLERTKDIRDKLCPQLKLLTRTVVQSSEDVQRWDAVLRSRGWTPEYRTGMSLPEAKISLASAPPKQNSKLCHFMKERDRLYIDWDGTVVPCCAHPRAGEHGNLLSHRFSEIFHNGNFEKMQEKMHFNRSTMDVCGGCTI